jgi:hypothetical protein
VYLAYLSVSDIAATMTTPLRMSPEEQEEEDAVYSLLLESSNLAWNTKLAQAQEILIAEQAKQASSTTTFSDGPDVVHSNISVVVQHAEITVWRSSLNECPENQQAVCHTNLVSRSRVMHWLKLAAVQFTRLYLDTIVQRR